MSLTEKKWQKGGFGKKVKCKLAWEANRNGWETAYSTGKEKNKQRNVYGGGNHKMTKQLHTTIYWKGENDMKKIVIKVKKEFYSLI